VANNPQNLIPGAHKLTLEEQSAGGIASGKARREKATMLSTLRKLLDEEGKNGMTYREMATLGLIKGAVKGNALNYKTIMECLGEGKGEDNTNGVLNELVEALKDAKKN
jgi:hypothetical protein